MITAKYDDPQHKKDITAKVVCVIPIFVPSLLGDEDKLASVDFTLACHEHYSAGIDYDLILVNNGTENDMAKSYLKTMSENGTMVLDRENVGFSFGAYKYAWEMFGDKYDYYFFQEQDVVPSKDNWLSDILSVFLSKKSVGAVGNFLEGRGRGHPLSDRIMDSIDALKNRNYMHNLDGMFTFTSSRVLKEVDSIGGLPVFPCIGHRDGVAVINETIFQQPILELGYEIAAFNNDGNHFYTYGIGSGGDKQLEHMSPILHGHVRHSIDWLKDYFSWYAR